MDGRAQLSAAKIDSIVIRPYLRITLYTINVTFYDRLRGHRLFLVIVIITIYCRSVRTKPLRSVEQHAQYFTIDNADLYVHLPVHLLASDNEIVVTHTRGGTRVFCIGVRRPVTAVFLTIVRLSIMTLQRRPNIRSV